MMQEKFEFPSDFLNRSAEVEVFSPGRINLIGEHTDYNQGYVLPTAIDKHIKFKFWKNGSLDFCRIYSSTYEAYFETSLGVIEKSENSWENYLLGVLKELELLEKSPKGFDCIIESNLPVGAGISSSAALECGFAYGLNQLFDLEIPSEEIARLGQRAENNFTGSNCGIMDQYASVMSRENHFLLLDCQNLDSRFIPANLENYSILLLNTLVEHNLASTEYNTRRKECEQAVQLIAKTYPDVSSLRDVNLEMLNEVKNNLSPVLQKRAKFVVEENKRVLNCARALEANQLDLAGTLMYESHRGLQHLYEVSCNELDFLVDLAETKNYIAGARMMGGGFGGCTINLIENDKIHDFSREASVAFYKKFGWQPRPIIVSISKGTHILQKK